MRRKFFTFFTLASVMLSTVVIAQSESSYTFSQSTRSYEALGSDKKTLKSGWQYPFNFGFPLSFSFKFWSMNQTSMNPFINDLGQIWFKGQDDNGLVVSAAGINLKGSAALAEGFLNYLVEGDQGKRIAKIEYEHVGFMDDNVGKGYISFQILFYEEDNTIEIHYGPSDFERSTPELVKPRSIGVFMGNFHISNASVTLSGDPLSPTIGNSPIGEGPSLTEFPKENTVYKFTPDERTGINKFNDGSANLQAWYIPEQRSIEIRSLNEEPLLQQYLYTMDGRKVMLEPAQTVGSAISRLNVSQCSAGLYLLHIETTKGRIAKKIYIH